MIMSKLEHQLQNKEAFEILIASHDQLRSVSDVLKTSKVLHIFPNLPLERIVGPKSIKLAKHILRIVMEIQLKA